ncbi:MAG TPA: regulator [Candidatus Eisenbacteria bacterium]|nr:regulator [Candidatus Eisenbacteria bacterium]
MQAESAKPRLWVPGDWNAFFGLGTNVLLNVLVLSSLMLFVVGLPSDTVFGRILPALAIALPLGNIFYAFLAYQLAKKEGRDDVAAMPYGPSVPHYFFVTFVIMLPVLGRTGDVLKAWEAGLAWAFLIGVVVLIGAFIGPTIRRYTPRAAMLGTLAGISIAFISMSAAFEMFNAAWIALATFAIILLSWTAGVRLPFGIPGGLAAIIVGTVIGWLSYAVFGWTGLSPAAVTDSFQQFGIHLPTPGSEVLSGLSDALPLLVTAIPLGVYNFTEGMNNVESASVAGDNYNLRHILLADGIGAVVGSFLGSPFPPAVYIGHPGWKAVGGRIGYSLATGVVIAAICLFGLVGLFLAVIPRAALFPILLFIGLVIGSQAFQSTKAKYAPAIVLAIVPNIAQWAKTLVDGALGAAGTNVATVGYDALGNQGVLYAGLERLGAGAVLAGLVLGAIAVFVINREYSRAIVYTLIAALLSLVGLIHDPAGLIFANVNGAWQIRAPEPVWIGYVLAAVVIATAAWRERALTMGAMRDAVMTPPEAEPEPSMA